jgi:L-iditol 2-dehydrogenase
VDHLRPGGRVTLFGGCPTGTSACFDTHRLHYDEITLRGVFHFTPADVKKAHGLLSTGTLDTKRLISGSYPLKGIEKAFGLLKRGRGIKYAIKP